MSEQFGFHGQPKGMKPEDYIDALRRELEAVKLENKQLGQTIFDHIVEPNCGTCSNQFGSENCDNGIICVGKVVTGEFCNFAGLRILEELTSERAKVERLRKVAEKSIYNLAIISTVLSFPHRVGELSNLALVTGFSLKNALKEVE